MPKDKTASHPVIWPWVVFFLLVIGVSLVVVFNNSDLTPSALKQRFSKDTTVASPQVANVTDNKADIEKIVAKFILDNPQLILDSVQRHQAERASADEVTRRDSAKKAIVTQQKAIFNDPNSPVMGNPQGDVTLVEFFDYSCGFCKRAAPSVATLIKDDPQLKIVFKEFPVLGKRSEMAGNVSLAVYQIAPDLYLDFHMKLMMNGVNSEDELIALATSYGIDEVALRDHMNGDKAEDMFAKNRDLATALGIRGTPAFIIGEEIFYGAIPLEQMTAAIAKARQK